MPFEDKSMKRFWIDKTAVVTALVGVLLMALTLLWRINPVEGSVVPEFLTDNPIGLVVMLALFVTCMPVWILVMAVHMWLPLFSDEVAWDAMLVVQAMVYFLIGKLISRYRRSAS